MNKMTEDQTKEFIHKYEQVLVLLGIATALIMDYREIYKNEMDDKLPKVDWFLEAFNNVIYLGKPLPEIPSN